MTETGAPHMSDIVLTALIGGIAGLLSGTVASIIAPWVNWGIEKKRNQLEYKAALIQRWRIIIASPFDRNRMLADPDYGALEPLLTEEVRNQLRRSSSAHIVVQGGSGDPNQADQTLLQREIARIEKEWGLV